MTHRKKGANYVLKNGVFGQSVGSSLTSEEDTSGNFNLYHWCVGMVHREGISSIHISGNYSPSRSLQNCKGRLLPEQLV